ncbi:hypothetical protein EAG_12464 [Camponotus floridanus]|uniref:Uncharacterized protein n=1 Tax=Camponotus floridanus TaxID=104421 RepID=E2B1A5_CAMFO|nr:hypothetical protein EAG_12464 [Camponotus floridanus]
MTGMIIAAGFGPPVTENTATALVPLMATLGSFVAKGTGYTLGTFVTTLGSLVTDETTPRFGAFVRKHARAGAVSLVPAEYEVYREFVLDRFIGHIFQIIELRDITILQIVARETSIHHCTPPTFVTTKVSCSGKVLTLKSASMHNLPDSIKFLKLQASEKLNVLLQLYSNVRGKDPSAYRISRNARDKLAKQRGFMQRKVEKHEVKG